MDLERSRIKADLDGLLEGEVFCDDVRLQLYASDGSIHQIRPLAVVRPTGTDDVVASVRYAAENQLPVHARGAGTSVTGGPLGRGIVVDFSAAMRRVLSIADDRVRLQPGVVLASLNRQLQEHQRLFGADPALRSVTTLGGLLSTNASGSHWLRYGSPRDKVQRLQLVLADASVIELNGRDAEPGDADPRVARLASEVSGLLRRRWTSLQEAAPATRVNHAGYSLTDLGGPDAVDLRRLIVGSEGTLGLITQAEVTLDPIPAHRGVTLLFFDRLEAAARAGIDALGLDVVACDLMDRRLLTIAREDDPRFARLIPAEAEAMLLVEQEGNTIDELQAKIQQLIQRLQRRRRLAFGSRFAIEVHERNLYWRLARRVTPSLYRLRGSQQAIPFVEEMAVAPDRLPAFLAEAHGVLNSLEVTASIFAHVGQGLVHLRPFLDLANAADRDKLLPLAERLYEKVLEFRGTVSGQYGDGLSRSWFLPRQYGRVYEAMREVKQLFDPANLLNPGKIVGDPPGGLTQQLRPVGLAAAFGPRPRRLRRPERRAAGGAAAPGCPCCDRCWLGIPRRSPPRRACNGCGRCRTTSPDQRMCPIFRLAPQEEASPRAKANLLRGLMSGELPPESIAGDALKEIADLCVHCHQCRLECPATVDIPKLMVEAKAQHVAASGLPISGWLLTRLDLLYWVGSRFPWVTNRILHSRSARWLLDRLFGLAQGRKLPRFARRSLTRWARGQGLHRPSRSARHKVLYFVDAVANWNDVELGRALVHVLRHNGITVFVPPAPSLSGMSLISEGLVDRALAAGAKERRTAGRACAAGASRGDDRAVGGVGAEARVPASLGRSGCGAGRGEYERRVHLPLEPAQGRATGTQFPPRECPGRLPSALPPAGLGRRGSRPGAARPGSRTGRGAARPRLQRNGRRLWAQTPELSTIASRRHRIKSRAPPPRARSGGDRMQHLPHPNGARNDEVHRASDQGPRSGVRLDARAERSAQPPQSMADAVLTLHVLLFAQALRAARSAARAGGRAGAGDGERAAAGLGGVAARRRRRC